MHTTIGTEVRLLSILTGVATDFQVRVASLFDEQMAHAKLISWQNELSGEVCVFVWLVLVTVHSFMWRN